MKIVKALFVADRVKFGNRITGTIAVPAGARIIHCGASPSDRGNVAVWVECSSIDLPQTVQIPLIILRHGDEIPDKAVFRGHVLANPILLIYELPMPGGPSDPN